MKAHFFCLLIHFSVTLKFLLVCIVFLNAWSWFYLLPINPRRPGLYLDRNSSKEMKQFLSKIFSLGVVWQMSIMVWKIRSFCGQTFSVQNNGQFVIILIVSVSTPKCSLLVMVTMLVQSEATNKLGKLLICSLVTIHELEYFFALDITSFLINE